MSRNTGWTPRPATLERFKQYFLGFAANGREIYPKLPTMAKRLGLSPRSASRYTSYLTEQGWLTTAYRTPRTAVRTVLIEHDRAVLRSMPYKEFLATDFWRFVRTSALRRAGNKCTVCNSKQGLEAHHKTYSHHGWEDQHPEDLIALCRDCHQLFHSKLAEDVA